MPHRFNNRRWLNLIRHRVDPDRRPCLSIPGLFPALLPVICFALIHLHIF
jgi:hypothetical protein